MKVRATRQGYYDGKLIAPQTVFDVPKDAKATWFEPVDNDIDTVPEIKARLNELGVEFSSSAKKAELEKLLAEAEK